MGKILTWFKALPLVWQWVIVGLLVLAVAVPGAGAWYYRRLTNMDTMFPDLNWPGDNEGDLSFIEGMFDDRVLNILLLGFDRDEARDARYAVYRPDTIMVAAINIDTGKVDLVSIPRDSLVPIHNRGGGRDKINHAYYYGWARGQNADERHRLGIESQIETVRALLGGIPIHYYVSLDMDAVVEVVNVMGGVWYDVPQDIHHRNGRLLLEAGYQKLNGRDFLHFVRNRQFDEGDYRRVRNQQDILLAAFTQFRQANKLIHAPQVYMSVRSNLETNLSLEQMGALALFGTRKVKPASITTHVLPGEFQYGRIHQGQTFTNIYYILDPQGRVDLLADVWGLDVPPRSAEVLLPPLPRPPDKAEEEEMDMPAEEVVDGGDGKDEAPEEDEEGENAGGGPGQDDTEEEEDEETEVNNDGESDMDDEDGETDNGD